MERGRIWEPRFWLLNSGCSELIIDGQKAWPGLCPREK